MTNELNFKELYEVSLKATYPIEVGGNTIEVGETIASFDKILIANFQEIKKTVRARGGKSNSSLIFWDTTEEVKISFSQGVFSKTQMALMANSELIENLGEEIIPINKREEFESDENCQITIEHNLLDPIFIYDINTGKKIKDWTRNNNTITLSTPYKAVVIDYWYGYTNGCITLNIGKALTNGFLTFIGKMKVKDDITGKVKTGILHIPKLKLMSDLSMKVGSDAIPQVGILDAIAIPEVGKGQQKVMEIMFLNDDIDADM